METPTPNALRDAFKEFDTRHQKIVAGMLGVMIKSPDRARDREWISEQLASISLAAGEFDADNPNPDSAVAAIEEFLKANAQELLRASYALFNRVALDLEPRVADGFTFDEALRCGLEYLPSIGQAADIPQPHPHSQPHPPDKNKAPLKRDLGEQPLANLMAEKNLKPNDLVSASTEQLTHKMVTRAMKGRRLTANTMGKIIRAWNQASESTHNQAELFNY